MGISTKAEGPQQQLAVWSVLMHFDSFFLMTLDQLKLCRENNSHAEWAWFSSWACCPILLWQLPQWKWPGNGEVNGLKATYGSATFHQDCQFVSEPHLQSRIFLYSSISQKIEKQNKTNYNGVLNCSWYVHRNYLYKSMRLRTWLFKVWPLMVSNKFCRSRQLKSNVVWLISGNRVELHFHSWSKSIHVVHTVWFQ